MAIMIGAFVVAVVAGGSWLALRPCTQCKDGWLSRSSGRGTCSWHGGVDGD